MRARLLAGPATGRDVWAALEIVLDPDFKTYWREPGESGLPPVFDWAGSTNVDSVAIQWPAPTRLEDASGVANGYTGRLVLPLAVTPRAASEPPRLALQADLGICHDICIPVRMSLAITLIPGEVAEQPDAVTDALERVPKPQELGSPGPLSILSVARSTAPGKAMLEVTVRAPLASAPQLFVEAPANWFLAVSDPSRPPPSQPETRIFRLDIAERPSETAGPVPLTLTLAAEGSAVESTVHLDAAQLAR